VFISARSSRPFVNTFFTILRPTLVFQTTANKQINLIKKWREYLTSNKVPVFENFQTKNILIFARLEKINGLKLW